MKKVGRRLSVAAGELTAGSRLEPSFIMVGAQRCGTTSLYRYLLSHPDVSPPVHHKGVYYFDLNYERGRNWYRAHFPRRSSTDQLTFEASGYYMFHPHAAARLARDLPGVKVVAMLRDPVERAYSAYQHEFERGFETESFDRALELEESRVEPELTRMLMEPSYQSFSHRHHAYRGRGEYASQLQPFLDGLGRDNVHVIESEALFAHPEEEYARLLGFLGLRVVMPAAFERHNARPRNSMSASTRAALSDHFAPHDLALARLLGRQVRWRR
jgi:hypothetical protein